MIDVSTAQLKSQQKLRDTIDRAIRQNSTRNNNGIVSFVADVVHTVRNLLDITKFFRKNSDESSNVIGGNVSGH